MKPSRCSTRSLVGNTLFIEALETRRFLSATLIATDAAGANYSTARDVDVVAKKRRWTESIGSGDRVDFYKIEISETRHFLANLSGLSGNLNLEIDRDDNGNGKYDPDDVVLLSTNHQAASEMISADLDAGTYYVRVYNPVAAASSNYTLSLQLTLTQEQARQNFFQVAARALALPGSGSFDLFVNVTGAPGESEDPKHIHWIDAKTYSWGIVNNSNLSTLGKPQFQDVSITKSLDKASPLLFLDAAQVSRLSTVVLDFWTSTGTRRSFFKITLSGARVTSFTQSGLNEDGIAEAVSFNYEKIKLFYIPQDAQGAPLPAVQAIWDVKGNKAA